MRRHAWKMMLLSVGCLCVGLFVACDTNEPAKKDTSKLEGVFAITAKLKVESPKIGQNTLMIEVKDKQGNAVKDVSIKVNPHMPAHGHGSTEEPKIESMGDGSYKAFPVTFQMPGEWEIIVDVTAGADKGKYTFTVQVR